MKRIGNRLLNCVLVAGALMITGFIVNYYFSYWNVAHAREAMNGMPSLPPDLPRRRKILPDLP